MAARMPNNDPIALSVGEIARWRHCLRDVSTYGAAQLELLVDRTRKIHHRAENLLAKEGVQGFQAWAAAAATSRPGPLHRWSMPKPRVDNEVLIEGQPCMDSANYMEVKRARWAAVWEGAWDHEEAADLRSAIRKAKQDAPPYRLTRASLDAGLREMDPKTGHGVDCMGPHDVMELPAGGRDELLVLLQRCLDSGRWPHQLWLVIIVLLRKPVDDRAIALVPWSRASLRRVLTSGLTGCTASGIRQSEAAAR